MNHHASSGRSSGQQQDSNLMLWPRLWRILITASILVGLWWWTGVSADIQTAPSTFIPRSIQVSQLP